MNGKRKNPKKPTKLETVYLRTLLETPKPFFENKTSQCVNWQQTRIFFHARKIYEVKRVPFPKIKTFSMKSRMWSTTQFFTDNCCFPRVLRKLSSVPQDQKYRSQP